MPSWREFKLAFPLPHREEVRRVEPPEELPEEVEEVEEVVHEQLLTFDSLANAMGQRPKSNKLKGLWKRSTRYKAVQSALEEVNEVVGDATVSDIAEDEQQRKALVKKLDKLAKKARKYLGKHKSKKERQKQKAQAMTALLTRVEHALAVFSDPDLDRVPETISLSQAIQMKVCGVQFKDVDFDNYPDGDIDRENSEEEFGSGNANTVSKLVYGEGEESRTLIFKPEPEVDRNPLLAQGKMGIDLQAPHYGERNVASQKLDALLGGNTVVKSRMVVHDGTLGLLMDKAEGKMPGERAKVPVTNQQQTYIDNVVQNNQPIDKAIKLLKAMEFVAREGNQPGELVWFKVEPYYADPFEGNPPNEDLKANIQQQLAGLEWADALCGQFDRHGENYLISFDHQSGTCQVTGIDNDLAFGKETSSVPAPGPDPTTGYNGVGLPPLIDRGTYDRILALSFKKDVQPELDGRLQPAEIKATRKRFNALQKHAKKLAKDGCVVDDWKTWRSKAGQTVTEYLGSQDPTNSYYMRDIHEHTV